ncbi:MAG: putative glycoside hydrolase [Candidatus Paceibacterota bacterium]
MSGRSRKLTHALTGFLVVLALVYAFFFFLPEQASVVYTDELDEEVKEKEVALINEEPEEPQFIVTYIETPEPMRAIYMTACVAATPSFRAQLVELVEQTTLNAIIINVKDEYGKISFETGEERFDKATNHDCFVSDLKEFIGTLHDKGIYVIGRIPVFQDPHLVKTHPEWAVRRESDGEIWKDRKGISWIDAGSREAWEYIYDLGVHARAIGFDELNFDYVRFPSDGNMRDIVYPFSEGKVKREVMRSFFEYIGGAYGTSGPAVSVDLFGMTTTNTDDLNIGQVLEDALPFVDYIAPMIYPSHYPPTFIGLANPAEHPYEVIHYSMTKAVERASTTPLKLRPWIQDFNLGATYDEAKIRAQIKAVEDVGLTSYYIWSPSNRYTTSALDYVQ